MAKLLREAARQLVGRRLRDAAGADVRGSATLPYSHFQRAAVLGWLFAPTAMGAVTLAAHVAWSIDSAGDLEAAPGTATTPARVRAAALVMAAAFYLVQIKAGVLSCLPGGVRAVGFSVYALVGVILTLVYSGFGKVVLSAGAK